MSVKHYSDASAILAAPFSFPTSVPTLSADFATSLTRSLLNQPLPLPVTAQNPSFPASDVRSRKENRQSTAATLMQPSMAPAPLPDQFDTRKFAQPVFNAGLGSTRGPKSEANTPSSRMVSSSGSRAVSSAGFGGGIGPIEPSASSSICALGESSSNTINRASNLTNCDDNITRTARNTTPVSIAAASVAKAVGQERKLSQTGRNDSISGQERNVNAVE